MKEPVAWVSSTRFNVASGVEMMSRLQVGAWAQDASLAAVIWTDLKPNFDRKLGGPFSVDSALAYLQSLQGDARRLAWEYLERAPAGVQTPLRRCLVEEGLIRIRTE